MNVQSAASVKSVCFDQFLSYFPSIYVRKLSSASTELRGLCCQAQHTHVPNLPYEWKVGVIVDAILLITRGIIISGFNDFSDEQTIPGGAHSRFTRTWLSRMWVFEAPCTVCVTNFIFHNFKIFFPHFGGSRESVKNPSSWIFYILSCVKIFQEFLLSRCREKFFWNCAKGNWWHRLYKHKQ